MVDQNLYSLLGTSKKPGRIALILLVMTILSIILLLIIYVMVLPEIMNIGQQTAANSHLLNPEEFL